MPKCIKKEVMDRKNGQWTTKQYRYTEEWRIRGRSIRLKEGIDEDIAEE